MQRVKDGGGRGTEARRIEAAGEQGRGLSPPPAILRGGRQYTHRVAKEARGGGRRERLEKATVFSPPPRSLFVRIQRGRWQRKKKDGRGMLWKAPPPPSQRKRDTRRKRGGGIKLERSH